MDVLQAQELVAPFPPEIEVSAWNGRIFSNAARDPALFDDLAAARAHGEQALARYHLVVVEPRGGGQAVWGIRVPAVLAGLLTEGALDGRRFGAAAVRDAEERLKGAERRLEVIEEAERSMARYLQELGALQVEVDSKHQRSREYRRAVSGHFSGGEVKVEAWITEDATGPKVWYSFSVNVFNVGRESFTRKLGRLVAAEWGKPL